jgi:hypothetical protein
MINLSVSSLVLLRDMSEVRVLVSEKVRFINYFEALIDLFEPRANTIPKAVSFQ